MSEWTWIDTLTRQFELCRASAGRDVVVVAETTTPQSMIDTAAIALQRTGAASSTILLPSRTAGTSQVPRSVLRALDAADMVIDCTEGGVGPLEDTDVLVIGSRSPAGIERLTPHPGLEERTRSAMALFADSAECTVTSPPGMTLNLTLQDAGIEGSWGCPHRERRTDQWPSGVVTAVLPADAATSSGVLVLMPGDLNVSLREIIHSPITLTIKGGRIVEIEGDSGDADSLRSLLEVATIEDGYRVSDISLGLNQAMAATRAFDPQQPRDELSRLSAGQVTISFGADKANAAPALVVGLRAASVQVGTATAVANGQLASELAPDVYEIAATAHD